jgi:hypothetical protein
MPKFPRVSARDISSSVSSKYTLPRMKQATNEICEDLPLFV